MARLTVLFDANIFYPAPIRDIVLQLAVEDFYSAKWTEDIHQEWIEALLRNEPFRERATLERTRDLMNKATRDCLITGYESLIPSLVLPDLDDCHVLAAAIVGRCDVIVTQNLKDFPEKIVGPYGIDVQHPDDFLSHYLNQSPEKFCDAIRKVRARLKNPPYAVETYLTILSRQGLVATTTALAQFAQLI